MCRYTRGIAPVSQLASIVVSATLGVVIVLDVNTTMCACECAHVLHFSLSHRSLSHCRPTPSLNVLCHVVCRSVLDLRTSGLPLVRSFGSVGSSAVVGQPMQLATSGNGGRMCASPWSNVTVLVPDNGNGRVVEVDFTTGNLVKVWITGISNPTGVAATLAMIAVCNNGATARVALYDLAGTLLRSFGSTPLAEGVTANVGVYLGYPWALQFSQDGATIAVVEFYSQRVTRWTVGTAAFASGA